MNALRSILYGLARILGDVQAGNTAIRKRSSAPIVKRAARRVAGRVTGRLFGRLFR